MKFIPGLVLMAAAAVPGTPEPGPGLTTAGVNFNLPAGGGSCLHLRL